jgi:hypothetical protein
MSQKLLKVRSHILKCPNRLRTALAVGRRIFSQKSVIAEPLDLRLSSVGLKRRFQPWKGRFLTYCSFPSLSHADVAILARRSWIDYHLWLLWTHVLLLFSFLRDCVLIACSHARWVKKPSYIYMSASAASFIRKIHYYNKLSQHI